MARVQITLENLIGKLKIQEKRFPSKQLLHYEVLYAFFSERSSESVEGKLSVLTQDQFESIQQQQSLICAKSLDILAYVFKQHKLFLHERSDPFDSAAEDFVSLIRQFIYWICNGGSSNNNNDAIAIQIDLSSSSPQKRVYNDDDDDDAPIIFMPEARITHTACMFGQYMYIFGGLNSNDTSCLNDLWQYDTKTRLWKQIHYTGETIPPRERHTAVVDVTKRRMIIFGGYDVSSNAFRDDIFAINLGRFV
eukprot:GEZU01019977.1.p1 GENE.GEZU01019977.1~~GEZU01019977.1.p1  ORF type:complete len:250 (-),score=47.39 GEZU01019977.1:47-796(-)